MASPILTGTGVSYPQDYPTTNPGDGPNAFLLNPPGSGNKMMVIVGSKLIGASPHIFFICTDDNGVPPDALNGPGHDPVDFRIGDLTAMYGSEILGETFLMHIGFMELPSGGTQLYLSRLDGELMPEGYTVVGLFSFDDFAAAGSSFVSFPEGYGHPPVAGTKYPTTPFLSTVAESTAFAAWSSSGLEGTNVLPISPPSVLVVQDAIDTDGLWHGAYHGVDYPGAYSESGGGENWLSLIIFVTNKAVPLNDESYPIMRIKQRNDDRLGARINTGYNTSTSSQTSSHVSQYNRYT